MSSSQKASTSKEPVSYPGNEDYSDEEAAAELHTRPPREPSPVWDIELDDSPPAAPKVNTGQSRTPELGASRRAESPVWDIELDLNP
jgi:hypothetical protein